MKRSAKFVVGGFASLGLVAGSYASASAATPATVPTGWFTGSIPWDGSTGAALVSLATETPAEADAAAVAAVPGTAGTAEVIHDHGYVVYRTIVTDASGNNTEVIVDAGDGTVLDQYAPLWNGVTATTTAASGTVAAATVPTGWFTGSIPWDGSTGVALIALATQTPAQASTAAVAAVPGTAGTPEVIHDHGYVVYRVIVTTAAGSNIEVIVDGGTGAVLDQYTAIWDGAPAVVASTSAATGGVVAATVPTGWFTGSIPSNGATGADLQAMATQTPAQASAAAVAAVPGTAGTPEVIHDHGYVVYRVIVTNAAGSNIEVIVDGGTGAVLDQYAAIWDGVTP